MLYHPAITSEPDFLIHTDASGHEVVEQSSTHNGYNGDGLRNGFIYVGIMAKELRISNHSQLYRMGATTDQEGCKLPVQ